MPRGLVVVRSGYVLIADTSALDLSRLMSETRGLNKQRGQSRSSFITGSDRGRAGDSSGIVLCERP